MYWDIRYHHSPEIDKLQNITGCHYHAEYFKNTPTNYTTFSRKELASKSPIVVCVVRICEGFTKNFLIKSLKLMQWIQDVHTYFCKRRVPCVNLFIMTIPSKSFCRIICMLENENIWELVFHSNHHEILLHLRIHAHERVMVHTVIIVSRDKYNIVSLIIWSHLRKSILTSKGTKSYSRMPDVVLLLPLSCHIVHVIRKVR